MVFKIAALRYPAFGMTEDASTELSMTEGNDAMTPYCSSLRGTKQSIYEQHTIRV